METEQVHREYFNDPQLYSLAMNTRDEVIVAGRGMGKGAIQAGRLMTCFQGMPGSMGGFVSPSVKRCLTNILPSMPDSRNSGVKLAIITSEELKIGVRTSAEA